MPVAYSLFVPGDSWLHRIDPRAKFAWLLCGFLFTITFNNPFYIIFIFLVTILMGITAGLKPGTFRLIVGGASIFALFGVLMWPFYFQQGPVLLEVFGRAITRDGLLFGLASGMRVGVMVAIATVWMSTTSPQDIAAGLMKLGIPAKAANGMTLAIRFVPMIRGELSTIMEAQRSRGLDFQSGNILLRARKQIPVIVPVMMRMFIIAHQLGLALDAKGFATGKSFTVLKQVRMTGRDYLFLATWMTTLLVSVWLRALGFGVIARDLL